MQSNGLRGSFAQNGNGTPLKRFEDGFVSPTSNYGLASPEFEGIGFQPLDSRLTYSSFAPPSDILLDGVKNGLVGSAAERGDGRVRSSALLNVNDAVSVHMLVETAMDDSQSYEVLAYDEVDAIKTELRSLQPRIEATSKKLALESKVRDAAQSLGRLNMTKKKEANTGSQKRNRRSMSNRSSTGSVKSVNDPGMKSDSEIAASVKKCDDLSRELWQLESRSRELQTQLLKHTAGILQMTHAGPSKRALSDGNAPNVRPDSPQSMYNYDTSRRKRFSQPEDVFDERSLYRTPENLDNLMHALKNGTHQTQIDEFNDMFADNQVLQSVETRLEELNNRLRDFMVKANPDRNQNYAAAPKPSDDGLEGSIERNFDYLDQCLHDISTEHGELQRRSRHSQSEVEGRLEGVNNQICGIINNLQSAEIEPYPQPPIISGRNMQEQIGYLQEALYALEQTASSQASRSDDAAQYEATLSGLWSIILAGEEEARQRKHQRRQNIAANPDGLEREEDLSADEGGDANEEFSLQAFSTKVQWLYSRTSNLKEQQSILRRQIRQQREMNSKSDTQHEVQEDQVRVLNNRIEDLEAEITNMRDDARIEASEMQANLQEASERIEELDRSLHAATSQREAVEINAQETANLLDAKDQELRELEGEVVRLQTEVTVARAELDGAYGTRAQRAAEVASNPEIKREIEHLGAKNATLREELKGMATEYEALTRDSIQNEKDRESLEAIIDALRDERERLELELSDEKVRWLGARSPGSVPQGPEMTSVRMMRDDFKKMMREKTTEALKALRTEQEERRRLEALVRQLRKGSEPVKSSLSHSMTPS